MSDKGHDVPDLAAGVASADLIESGIVASHFGEEDVLLIRRGGHVCALAATCTHLGGALAERLVRDGEIVCPWHHARFDLGTGEAVAPAFNPLDTYDVEERDGRVGSNMPRCLADLIGRLAKAKLEGGLIYIDADEPSVRYDSTDLANALCHLE